MPALQFIHSSDAVGYRLAPLRAHLFRAPIMIVEPRRKADSGSAIQRKTNRSAA
jgi:hypothetical protein